MEQYPVAVVSRRNGLRETLKERCEGFVFGSLADVPDAAIAIVDRDQAEGHLSPRPLCRIILDSGTAPEGREVGDLSVDIEAFERDPKPYMLFCRDLAKSRRLVTQLLGELEFSQHVQELVAIADFDAAAERITRTLLGVLESPAATLLLHDPRIERFVVAFTNDSHFHDDGDYVPGIPAGLLEQALTDARGYGEAPAPGGTAVVLPIQVGQDLIGVFRATIAPGAELPVERGRRAVRYIEAITAILGNLYQLTRSNELAMRDDLTKAYNRRFFESNMDEEIERSRRYGTFFSIIFLDLDDLKVVNNTWGHLAGSRTLQEVARRILGAVRGIDKVVRFGGDEFCIVLPQTDQEQAKAVANRVRRAFAESTFRLEADIQVAITASFGIATFPVHATTKEDLIRQADAAMYRVKSTTKNSVGMAEAVAAARRQA